MVPDDTLSNTNNQVPKNYLLKASTNKLLDISHSKNIPLIHICWQDRDSNFHGTLFSTKITAEYGVNRQTETTKKNNVHSLLKMTCTLIKLT